MKVTVFGSGYVGLVTGACLAEVGNHVLCVDIDPARVSSLKKGKVPIYEPGLTEMVKKGIAAGNLKFTTNAAEGVAHGLLLFIAVGTPSDEDGSADLQHVEAVARTIGECLDDYRIVINKSTVPVGTADRVRQVIDKELLNRKCNVDFDVVSNPEFLKEGAAINDFMKPDRIIVGFEGERAREPLRELYAPFNRNHEKLIEMDTRSAELTKYAANAMLATKISFMNEMANLAELVGADIESIRNGIGADPRIGYHFIYPGCGYGGSCFPKDVRALIHMSNVHNHPSRIFNAVNEVNIQQKGRLFEKIQTRFIGKLKGVTVALWGLSFKPNTDDMREAPSRDLMEALWAHGAKVQAYDPIAMNEARHIYGDRDDLLLADSPYAALKGADALVIVTEWSTFRSPDFDQIKQELKQPIVFDGRNLFEPDDMAKKGIEYFAIGRGHLPG